MIFFRKPTWLAGKPTVNEDVFLIENGDFLSSLSCYVTRKKHYPLGSGFNSFLFSPLFGEDFHFSNGLKPPTRLIITYLVAIGSMGPNGIFT